MTSGHSAMCALNYSLMIPVLDMIDGHYMTKKPVRNRSTPSTTAEDREAKRLRILIAAAAEFAEFGFDNASIEKIAERADIGKGTVYNYIRSKDQLFAECLQLFCDELFQLIEATVMGVSELTLMQRVLQLSDRLADLADRRNDFVTLYFRSIFGATSVGRDLAVQSARDIIIGVERLLVMAQGTGVVRTEAPADLLAPLIFMNRLVFSRMLDNLGLRDHSRSEQAAFLFDMHWRGIKTELAP
jgi:AcrR family transcriptional regulator